jgi:hypothetical protein
VTADVEEKLDQTYRVTLILAIAMIASVLMYAGVVELLSRLAPATPASDPETVELLRQVFRALALVQFVALAWLGGRARRPEGSTSERLQRLKTLSLVCLALAESIAVCGLVLFLLSRDPSDFYYLLLLSLLSFVLAFPRRDRFREALAGSLLPPSGNRLS